MVDRITFELSDAYDAYFEQLAVTGQFGKREMNNLMFVGFIEDIATSEMSHYITEDDKRSINNVLDCIRKNSCLFAEDAYDSYDSIYSLSNIIYSNRTTHMGNNRIYGNSDSIV